MMLFVPSTRAGMSCKILHPGGITSIGHQESIKFWR